MLNHITVQARLTRDPEKRMLPSGKPVTSFSVACERDFKNQDGTRETDFIDCVCFGKLADVVANYFSKGRMAIVSGRLQIRGWTDKDGNKRRSAEIVADNVYFGDSKHDSEGTASTSYQSPGYTAPDPGYTAPAPASDFAVLDDPDSELPF